jgi:DNA uptake protein ComE-like DNA-binding protein
VISTKDENEEEDTSGPEGEDEKGGILGRTVGAILGVGAGQEEREEGVDEPESDEPDVLQPQAEEPTEASEEPEPAEEETPAEPQIDEADKINLNRATFEQLRDVGFSVTQATRVLTYRERQDGFASVDDLANVPGMPRQFLREVKPNLTL